MTINDRIKYFRKEIKGINQKEFAKVLGVTQSGVSYMEQKGSTVADSSIKAICSVFDVNEEWLRNGTEPMFAQPTTFSLDDFAKAKGATPLELKIMKTYFELDPDIRKAAMDFFKKQLLSAVAADPGLIHLLRPETVPGRKLLKRRPAFRSWVNGYSRVLSDCG